MGGAGMDEHFHQTSDGGLLATLTAEIELNNKNFSLPLKNSRKDLARGWHVGGEHKIALLMRKFNIILAYS